MSARNKEKKGSAPMRPDDSRDSEGLYLYCIGDAGSLSGLLKDSTLTAIEGGPVELIESGGLAAVCSRVPLADYGEEALPSHLTDAAWMALRAMRHERVVDYFARRTSVIPLRFGTIYLEGGRVKKMLAEKEEELRETIERLSGCEEWGVNVFCERKTLMDNITSYSERLKELDEQAAKASPGQAYLMRKKMDAMRADEARVEVRRAVSRIEQELQTVSMGAKGLRLLKDEAGAHGELVGKLAFLVERESFEDFRRAAERLALENEDRGFRLELTGPWPTYNFVSAK